MKWIKSTEAMPPKESALCLFKGYAFFDNLKDKSECVIEADFYLIDSFDWDNYKTTTFDIKHANFIKLECSSDKCEIHGSLKWSDLLKLIPSNQFKTNLSFIDKWMLIE